MSKKPKTLTRFRVGDRVRICATSRSSARGRIGTVVRAHPGQAGESRGITVRLDDPIGPGEDPDWIMQPAELERL